MRPDPGYWWRAYRTRVLSVLAVIVVLVAIALVLTTGHPAPRRATAAQVGVSSTTRRAGSSTSTSSASTGASRRSGATTPSPGYRPSYSASVPNSTADQRAATVVAQNSGLIAATEACTPPTPAWSAAYPSLPRGDWRSETRYITAFVGELLDRDYRTQPRADLARWVSAESAGALLPGVPARAADNDLYASLFCPRQTHTAPGVVPPQARWAQLARQGVRVHVTHVFINPDETWVRDVAAGLTSRDPLTDDRAVNGTMTVTRHGRTVVERFALQLSVGSALHHPGYGASEIDAWTVS
jgi:hypothetical protein